MKTPLPQRIADLAARVFPWALLVAALAVPLWAIWRLGPDAIPGYLRNVRLDLYKRARRIITETRP